jgi:lipopolysaccharide export system permease protein
MVLRELVKVFVLSLVGITGILLMAGIIAEASQQGLGPAQILAAIPLLVPSTLPYTIPATTLFATCVVYGRLAADNEVLAIKAAGVNLFQVVKPGLVLGVAMSATTMALYYQVIPYTHHLLRSMVFNDAEELLYSVLKKQHMISHSQMPYSMFVKEVQGKKLLSVVIKKRDEKGHITFVANAREAELRVHVPRKLLLVRMRNGVASGEDGSRAYFEDRTFDLTLPNNIGNANQTRPRDMTWQELLARRGELEETIRLDELTIAAATAGLLLQDAPLDLPKHRQNLLERRKMHDGLLLAVHVEMQMRPALSLGCLCFILVGCPVGIWFSRSDYLSAFITCFLPIVIVYYPLLLCCTGLARDSKVFLVPLVWSADAVIGAVGVGLFWRLVRN